MNGIVATQEGIPVDEALDAQKVVDSRWRYFEILTEEFVDIQQEVFSGKSVKIYKHGLGFLPAFELYHLGRDEYADGDIVDGVLTNGAVADEEYIYYVDDFSGDDFNGRAFLRIYNINITEEYEAPIEFTFAKQVSKPSRYGIKATNSKNLNALEAEELSGYSMNTNSKALAVQKTGVARSDSSSSFRATIEHKLGQPPNYLTTRVSRDLRHIAAIRPDFVPVIASADSNVLVFRGAQSALIGNFAYIIFKEFADLAV